MILTLLLTLGASAAQETPPALTPKVLMIALDGFHPDDLVAAQTPNLDQLIKQGVLTLKGRAGLEATGKRAWQNMLTGTRPRLRASLAGPKDEPESRPLPSWLEQFEAQHPESFSAAIYQGRPVHRSLRSAALDVATSVESASEVTRAACAVLQDAGQDISALYLHYIDLKSMGSPNSNPSKNPKRTAKIEALDAELGTVLEALRTREQLSSEDWLILVGSNHDTKLPKRNKKRPRFSIEPEGPRILLLASGSGAKDHQWRSDAELIDLAPLALAHLGVHGGHLPSAPPAWTPEDQLLLNRRNQRKRPAKIAPIAFIGDSLSWGWDEEGRKPWLIEFGPQKFLVMANPGDRTDHLLWRLRQDALQSFAPEVAVILIGTNNVWSDDAEHIALGVQNVVAEVLALLPESKVLLLAIFPRGKDELHPFRQLTAEANQILKDWAPKMPRIEFLDINAAFLKDSTELTADFHKDLVHLNAAGYGTWARELKPTLLRMLESD